MSLVVWTAGFLSDTAAADIMTGAEPRVMKVALDQFG